MSKLLVHLIGDFLRDDPTTAGQFGETLRCAILDNENVALAAYGMSNQQINVLITRDRKQILDALSDEIGAVMDELDWGKIGLKGVYPAGGVHLREARVLYSNGNNRTIEIRGSGFEPGRTVDFVPKAGGGAVAGNIQGRNCDKDVWQRLFVTANLAAGTWATTVTRPTGSASDTIDLVVP